MDLHFLHPICPCPPLPVTFVFYPRGSCLQCPSALLTIKKEPEPGRIRRKRILFRFWPIATLRGPRHSRSPPVLCQFLSDYAGPSQARSCPYRAPGSTGDIKLDNNFGPVFSVICHSPMPGGGGSLRRRGYAKRMRGPISTELRWRHPAACSASSATSTNPARQRGPPAPAG